MNSIFKIHKIDDKTYRINDQDENSKFSVDAYLIIGEKEAILFDCLFKESNLIEVVQSITTLPVKVVISHGHGDHAGLELKNFIKKGFPLYLSHVDIKLLNYMNKTNYNSSDFIDLHEHDIFDLGNRELEVITLAGHTPGCIVLLDRKNKMIFSGDAIGSGHIWLQLPLARPLSEFVTNASKLYEITKLMDDLVIYPGHYNQSKIQLTNQYIIDLIEVASKIVNKEIEGNTSVEHYLMEGSKTITYGTIGFFVYNPNNL